MPQIPHDLAHLTVLAAFAHPDDEGFGPGGTLALLAARGASLTLICATNGDVGEISDPALATPENLFQVRQEELRAAMVVTGVPDVRFLGYRDSGMEGTPDNNHSSSLSQAPAEEVVRRLVDIIREVRPGLVITHDPSGGYGHPDHITVYQRMTEAFSSAGEPPPGSGANGGPWAPGSLYYVCFPRSNFRHMWQHMVDNGVTPPFASVDLDKIGSPNDAVTTTLDVSRFVDTKIASLACHRTQINPDGPFSKLPQEMMREIMSTEYFTLAVSQGENAGTDPLAGLS